MVQYCSTYRTIIGVLVSHRLRGWFYIYCYSVELVDGIAFLGKVGLLGVTWGMDGVLDT